MKNLFFYVFLFSLSLNFMSCEKENQPSGIPECVETKIDELKADLPSTCGGAMVTEYSFQDKLVYVYYDGAACVDGGSTVFSESCEQLCFLGGLAGLKTCEGEDFFDVAVKTRVIWEEE